MQNRLKNASSHQLRVFSQKTIGDDDGPVTGQFFLPCIFILYDGSHLVDYLRPIDPKNDEFMVNMFLKSFNLLL